MFLTKQYSILKIKPVQMSNTYYKEFYPVDYIL